MARAGAEPMVRLTLDRVLHVTSEDPVHVAANLLMPDHSHKWTCHQDKIQERSHSVVLELRGGPHKISRVDIANSGTGMVTVMVSDGSSPKFETDASKACLLPMHILLQEKDIGQQSKLVATHSFGLAKLNKPAAEKPWKRLQIDCRQQFAKRLRFGLASVVCYKKAKPKPVPWQLNPAPPKPDVVLRLENAPPCIINPATRRPVLGTSLGFGDHSSGGGRAQDRPLCPHGDACRNKNARHRIIFTHPARWPGVRAPKTSPTKSSPLSAKRRSAQPGDTKPARQARRAPPLLNSSGGGGGGDGGGDGGGADGGDSDSLDDFYGEEGEYEESSEEEPEWTGSGANTFPSRFKKARVPAKPPRQSDAATGGGAGAGGASWLKRAESRDSQASWGSATADASQRSASPSASGTKRRPSTSARSSSNRSSSGGGGGGGGKGGGKGAASALPRCKYGDACYRTNPDHRRSFAHPPGWSPCPKPARTTSAAPNPGSRPQKQQPKKKQKQQREDPEQQRRQQHKRRRRSPPPEKTTTPRATARTFRASEQTPRPKPGGSGSSQRRSILQRGLSDDEDEEQPCSSVLRAVFGREAAASASAAEQEEPEVVCLDSDDSDDDGGDVVMLEAVEAAEAAAEAEAAEAEADLNVAGLQAMPLDALKALAGQLGLQPGGASRKKLAAYVLEWYEQSSRFLQAAHAGP